MNRSVSQSHDTHEVTFPPLPLVWRIGTVGKKPMEPAKGDCCDPRFPVEFKKLGCCDDPELKEASRLLLSATKDGRLRGLIEIPSSCCFG